MIELTKLEHMTLEVAKLLLTKDDNQMNGYYSTEERIADQSVRVAKQIIARCEEAENK